MAKNKSKKRAKGYVIFNETTEVAEVQLPNGVIIPPCMSRAEMKKEMDYYYPSKTTAQKKKRASAIKRMAKLARKAGLPLNGILGPLMLDETEAENNASNTPSVAKEVSTEVTS